MDNDYRIWDRNRRIQAQRHSAAANTRASFGTSSNYFAGRKKQGRKKADEEEEGKKKPKGLARRARGKDRWLLAEDHAPSLALTTRSVSSVFANPRSPPVFPPTANTSICYPGNVPIGEPFQRARNFFP
ncbi:hypothetical protein KM043_015370 [Ampulex compressa]|nr:hypothetical protein KM043_015370 [Ampulex compressa]